MLGAVQLLEARGRPAQQGVLEGVLLGPSGGQIHLVGGSIGVLPAKRLCGLVP